MYSVIDIESNGAGFRKESIIEIAVYKYDGHEIVDQFMSLVNPDSDITPFVQKLTGITPKMVRTAPRFHEIAKRVVEMTAGTTLVGHNIEFDYRMLRQEFKRLGYDYRINTLDTIPLAKKLIPEAESYSLGKLVKSLGIPLVDHHRAAGDARATLDLFKLLIIKDKDSEIIQQQHEHLNADTYLNKIRDLTQDLPSERGIIYFQNEDGKIIYSDFTDDLRKFAKSVFISKLKKWKQIQDDVKQIHYELTGNDVLAKLMMRTKGLYRKESLPFGLFFRNGKYVVEKINPREESLPILRFKSFTQGLKVASFIKSREEFQNADELIKLMSLQDRSEMWICEGRTRGEKAFIILKEGKITSYGFYDLYTQIQTWSKISKIKIDLSKPTGDLQNDLRLLLLKGDCEIQEVPA